MVFPLPVLVAVEAWLALHLDFLGKVLGVLFHNLFALVQRKVEPDLGKDLLQRTRSDLGWESGWWCMVAGARSLKTLYHLFTLPLPSMSKKLKTSRR